MSPPGGSLGENLTFKNDTRINKETNHSNYVDLPDYR